MFKDLFSFYNYILAPFIILQYTSHVLGICLHWFQVGQFL